MADLAKAAIEARHKAEARTDEAEAHYTLLANAVTHWNDARVAYLWAQSVAPADLTTAEPAFQNAEHALAGIARMIEDVAASSDIVLIHRAAIHRRDRALAQHQLDGYHRDCQERK
jgi:hypothetical protein